MRLIINAKISPARKVNLHILDPLGAAQEFMVNRLETRGNWKPAKHAGKIGWEILGNDYPLKVILVLPFPSSFPAIFSQAWGQKPPRDPKSKPAAAVFSHSLGAPGTEVTAAKHQFFHVDRFGCVMLCLNIYKFTRFVWTPILYNYPKIT